MQFSPGAGDFHERIYDMITQFVTEAWSRTSPNLGARDVQGDISFRPRSEATRGAIKSDTHMERS